MFGLLLSFAITSQTDATYKLTDFRIPDAGAIELEIAASMGLSGSQGDWQDTSRYEEWIQGSAGSGASLKWNLRFLGEKRYLNIRSSAFLEGDAYSHKYEERRDTLDTTWSDTYLQASGRLFFSSSAGWYLGNSPCFLGFSGDFYGDEYVNYYSYRSPEIWVFMPTLDGELFVGAGIGKIRNVRPVIHAWQFLEEIGQENRPNIQNLAEILATQWSYELKHWRYEKYFYQDIEKLLVEKDVVSRLSPYEVMRLREIISSVSDSRLYGARFSTMIGARASYDWSISVKPGLLMSFSGGYPLSRHWQIGAYARGEILFPELAGVEYDFLVNAYVHYYLGERWRMGGDVSARHRWLPGWQSEVKYRRTQMEFVPLEVKYYLDDKLAVNAGLRYSLNMYKSTEQHSSLSQDFQLSAGLVWRLR